MTIANMTIDEVADRVSTEILKLKKNLGKKMFIVAIEGKGCSGKSRMSQSLKQKISDRGFAAEAVSIDDFCNPRSTRYDDSVSLGLQVYANNFDSGRFAQDILKSAMLDQTLEFDDYMLDTATDEYTTHVKVWLPEGGVLLVEGLHILKDEFFEYIDYAIFLHISDEEQLRRALIRDAHDRNKARDEILYKYKERFVPSYNHFMRIDKPLEKADTIVRLDKIEAPLFVSKEEVESFHSCHSPKDGNES